MKGKLVLETPYGNLQALHDQNYVYELILPGSTGQLDYPNSVFPLLEEELSHYLAGFPVKFSVPLSLSGYPPFTLRVLEYLKSIPWGMTVSYGDIASYLGRPGGARAVGQAVKRNPIPIIVPCHRVIAWNNKLGGFSGRIDVKRWLLKLENIEIEGDA